MAVVAVVAVVVVQGMSTKYFNMIFHLLYLFKIFVYLKWNSYTVILFYLYFKHFSQEIQII